MKYGYKTGHIDPFWDNGFKEFNYVQQPLMDSEIAQWESEGYKSSYVKSFSGSMYNNTNPMPEWINKFENLFGLKNQTYNFYKMKTLEIMPTHSDHYQTYIKLFNANPEKVCRVLVMLEDWKPGHYLEVDGRGFVNWRAGDYFLWQASCEHAASNIGIQDRYTLQITGELYSNIGIEEPEHDYHLDLHWMNFPDIAVKETTLDKTIQHIFNLTGLPKNTPTFIYLGNRNIVGLEQLVHTKKIEKDIHIFLYEPLCYYIKDRLHTAGFYTEFKHDTDINIIRAEELDSIREYAIKNNISKEKIIVHTCEYQIEQYIPYYNDSMTLICDDIFLKSYPEILNNNDNYEFFMRHTFLCLNWRYSKHRHLVTAFVDQLNSKYSWYYKCSLTTLDKDLWFNFLKWEKTNPLYFKLTYNGINKFNEHSPICLDIHTSESVNVGLGGPYWPTVNSFQNHKYLSNNNATNHPLEKFYNESFCIIVNETRFAQHAANYSEKVYQAIQYKKPFVVVGPPKTLEYMRSQGIKTFSEFWDESYDDEIDHEKRLIKIFDLLRDINKFTYKEKIDTYLNMIPLLKSNFELLKTKIRKVS
jgi:hypothetical protein